MKRIALICALLMTATAFTACSGNSSSKKDETTSVTAAETSAEESEVEETTVATFQAFSMTEYSAPEYSVPEISHATFVSTHLDPIELPGNNYGAEVDDSTGAVTLDASVMFASDSSEISADGKKALDKFLDDYCDQMLGKNKDKLKRIKVEGHTDTEGTHEYNQKLSEDRANAVMNYSISKHPELKQYMYAVGCSYDNPVYNSDGSVNMEKSRRVVFVPET